jgi:hypothetical protein
MDSRVCIVILFLCMSEFIRKNDLLIEHEPDIAAIFAYLEDNSEKPHARRVEIILELLSTSLISGASARERSLVTTTLRKALARYRWVSYVAITADGFHVSNTFAGRGLSKDDDWEHEAVRNLLAVVPQLGDPPRIRRCVECNRWIFAAKRKDKETCGGKCRQSRYESIPENREKKRAKMKELRATKKRLEQRELTRNLGKGLVLPKRRTTKSSPRKEAR